MEKACKSNPPITAGLSSIANVTGFSPNCGSRVHDWQDSEEVTTLLQQQLWLPSHQVCLWSVVPSTSCTRVTLVLTTHSIPLNCPYDATAAQQTVNMEAPEHTSLNSHSCVLVRVWWANTQLSHSHALPWPPWCFACLFSMRSNIRYWHHCSEKCVSRFVQGWICCCSNYSEIHSYFLSSKTWKESWSWLTGQHFQCKKWHHWFLHFLSETLK